MKLYVVCLVVFLVVNQFLCVNKTSSSELIEHSSKKLCVQVEIFVNNCKINTFSNKTLASSKYLYALVLQLIMDYAVQILSCWQQMAKNKQLAVLFSASFVQMSNRCNLRLGNKVYWAVSKKGCICSAEGYILFACFPVRIQETTVSLAQL